MMQCKSFLDFYLHLMPQIYLYHSLLNFVSYVECRICNSNCRCKGLIVLVFVTYPSNSSRAHCSVCSIALGKFLRVQIGILFSGGSWDELYDSVRNGTTTWNQTTNNEGYNNTIVIAFFFKYKLTNIQYMCDCKAS